MIFFQFFVFLSTGINKTQMSLTFCCVSLLLSNWRVASFFSHIRCECICALCQMPMCFFCSAPSICLEIRRCLSLIIRAEDSRWSRCASYFRLLNYRCVNVKTSAKKSICLRIWSNCIVCIANMWTNMRTNLWTNMWTI